MIQLKTLSRQDPEFEAYLRGTFSKTARALPVSSLNVGTDTERVTFRILPVQDIPRPNPVALWAQVFRVRNFVFVLFPLFLILIKNLFDEVTFDPWLTAFSTLGALSLSLGAMLLNDYQDHVRGVDRVHPLSGSRAIQKGWVTAEATRLWSWFYLVCGGLLGLPALWVFPKLAWIVVVPALFALVSWIFPRIGLKYRRGAELVVFLVYGPLLTVGFQIAITGRMDLESVWIGILTGWHFVFLVHLKNFESILYNSQAGFQNSISAIGFEAGRRFLNLWWIGFLVLLDLYEWVYHSPTFLAAFVLLPVVFTLPFWRELKRLTSPVGSQMPKVARLGRGAALLTLLLWALQFCWYWLVVELGSQA